MNNSDRPRVLEALCMLSFLGSGGGFLLYLAAAVFYRKAQEIVLKFSSLHTTDGLSPLYFLLFSLFFLISLLGVIRMWNLKRSGFYMYTAAQVMILSWPLAWMGLEAFSATALIFTVLFLGAYTLQFSRLRA
ncbi:MAG: hypothetical protein ACOZDD_11415 [Bacteroidota bacterium]